MRLNPLVPAAWVLWISWPAFAQPPSPQVSASLSERGGGDWVEFASRTDRFTVNFPAEPQVREIPYRTEYGIALPAHVYSHESRSGRYSVTVVDYANVEKIHAERLKNCTAYPNLCNSPWVADLRGALDYAAWGFLQRDAKVTHYAYGNMDRVEGRNIQLANADRSRTFAAVHMHENRLYILEGTVPAGAPPPGLFQQSLGFLDEDGIRVRYESVYANSYPPPPRVQYGRQGIGVPDLSGLKQGMRRTFTEGPFAGQTWGVDGSGQPYLVQERAPSAVQGVP